MRHEGVVTTEIAEEALTLLEVDDAGLERFDRELLRCSPRSSGAGRSGSRRWRSRSARRPETIEDVYEPFLLQLGFLQRTPRGRIVTDLGRGHLGAPPEPDTLF